MVWCVVSVLLQLALWASVEAWKFETVCIKGNDILHSKHANGTIGGFTKQLQRGYPTTYGNLAGVMVTDTHGHCLSAEYGLNLNRVTLDALPTEYGMKAADENSTARDDHTYLYIFDNLNFYNYQYISDCVPGGVVGTNLFNMTGGYIGVYTVVLQALLGTVDDSLVYLGRSNSSTPCLDMAEHINKGNLTTLLQLQKNQLPDKMQQVGALGSTKVGDPKYSYLYVFTNKLWNATWDMIGPPVMNTHMEAFLNTSNGSKQYDQTNHQEQKAWDNEFGSNGVQDQLMHANKDNPYVHHMLKKEAKKYAAKQAKEKAKSAIPFRRMTEEVMI